MADDILLSPLNKLRWLAFQDDAIKARYSKVDAHEAEPALDRLSAVEQQAQDRLTGKIRDLNGA